MIRWLVFSDLDGTLLDESYDWRGSASLRLKPYEKWVFR